jgi:hypothetical protein
MEQTSTKNSNDNTNKSLLIIKITDLNDYIDILMSNRKWDKICDYKIDSDRYKRCKSVVNNRSLYSILHHNFYRMPENKQGFILVKISGQYGINNYDIKLANNDFKIKLEIILYYIQDKYIDRKNNEPELWSYLGGYNMDIVREIYVPNVDLSRQFEDIDSYQILDLIKYFEEIKEYIPDGQIDKMRLHTLIPDRCNWPGLENEYWSKIAKDLQKMIKNGTGLLSSIKDDITLEQFIKSHNYINLYPNVVDKHRHV